jgi:hypothetical protein
VQLEGLGTLIKYCDLIGNGISSSTILDLYSRLRYLHASATLMRGKSLWYSLDRKIGNDKRLSLSIASVPLEIVINIIQLFIS